MTYQTTTSRDGGHLRSFLCGFFVPFTVHANLIRQEPMLGDIANDGEYLRSIWQDVGNLMSSAMNEYASHEN